MKRMVIGLALVLAACSTPTAPPVETEPGEFDLLAQLKRTTPEQFLPMIGSLAGLPWAYTDTSQTWHIYNDNTNPAWNTVQFYRTGQRVQYFSDQTDTTRQFDSTQTCGVMARPWCPDSPLALGWIARTAYVLDSYHTAEVDTSMGWQRVRFWYDDFEDRPRRFTWGKQLQGPHIDGVE